MKKLKEFIIQFDGLALGDHQFNYSIEDSFFAFFELTEIINKGKIAVSLKLSKHSNMLLLYFKLKGKITTSCDRCLEPVKVEIKGDPRLIVKFGDEKIDETDEIIILPNGAKELDISGFLYETIYLLLPPRNVHQENKCNQEVINKLNNFLVKEKSENNPQWDVLKKLKNK